jgi:GGDEF domain-containing protein
MRAAVGSTQTARASERKTTDVEAVLAWPEDFARTALTLSMYGLAVALLLYRAPAIFGSDWSWLGFLVVPMLTVLVGGLQTGTALALVLVYAFAYATSLAVQGYRLGWGQMAQVEGIASHFATVFFLASAVALMSLLRSNHTRLVRAEELVRRNMSQDEISGLLTPASFEAAAVRELIRSRRTSRGFLVLALDVRDYLRPADGSAAVPNAERIVGRILTEATRSDFDLWTMAEPGLYLGLLVEADEQAVGPCLERVLAFFARTYELNSAVLARKARFGYSSYPEGGDHVEALISAAMSSWSPLKSLVRESTARGRGEGALGRRRESRQKERVKSGAS